MTEKELIDRLRRIDLPVEPSEAFRIDLLAHLQEHRQSDPKQRESAPTDPQPRVPDELWAAPARRGRRLRPEWAVAAFVVVLLAGAMTWWLGPGARDRAPTATDQGPATSAAGEGASVVQVPAPGTNDEELLQEAIDDNPGAVLQLQAGTYDLYGRVISVPHGVTLRGASTSSGARQTKILGPVQIDALGPEHSDEEVILRDIEIESAGSEFTLLYGRHGPEEHPDSGASLAIENVLIRSDAFTAVDIHARGIDVLITSSVVVSTKGYAIYVSDGGDNTIEIGDNRVEFVHYGISVPASGGPGRPDTTSTIEIQGNDLRAGPLPPPVSFPEHVTGLEVGSHGRVTVSGNTVEIPYGNSDPDNPAVGIGIYADGEHRRVVVNHNRLIGGQLAEEATLRVGIDVRSTDGTYARNTLEGSWATGIMVTNSGNTFEDNSLRNVNPTPEPDEPVIDDPWPTGRNGLPATHWWLRASSSGNTIADNTFEELSIVDSGEGNSYPESFELVEP